MSGDRLHPMTRRQLRLCIGVTGPIPAKSSGKTSTATASLGSRHNRAPEALMYSLIAQVGDVAAEQGVVPLRPKSIMAPRIPY
jgi:hypothetical protein